MVHKRTTAKKKEQKKEANTKIQQMHSKRKSQCGA